MKIKLLTTYLKLKERYKFYLLLSIVFGAVKLSAQQNIVYCNESNLFTTYILSDDYKIATDYDEVYLLNKNNLIVDTLSLEHKVPIQTLQVIDNSNFSIAYVDFAAQVSIADEKFRIKKIVALEDKLGVETESKNFYKIKLNGKGNTAIFSLWNNYVFVSTNKKMIVFDLETKSEIKICELKKNFSPFQIDFPIIVYTPEKIFLNIISENRCYIFEPQKNKIHYIELPEKAKKDIWFYTFDMKTKMNYLVKKEKKSYNIYKYDPKKNNITYIAFYDEVIQIYDDELLTYKMHKEGGKTILCTVLEPLKMNLNSNKMNLLPEVEVK